MWSPYGRGAGPRRATLASILTVVLMGLAAVPVLGAHHLEGEGAAEAAKPAKIIVIAPDEFTALVGAKRTFWASICNEDGSGCKDAKKAKWSVVPKKGLKLSKKKGVQVLVEGARAGTYKLSAKQNGVSGTVTVKFNEPPQNESQPREARLRVIPEEPLTRIGEPFVLTTLSCPAGVTLAEAGSYAVVQAVRRSVFDEVDDWLTAGCEPEALTEVNPHETIRELHRDGHQTLLVRDRQTDDFAGVQVVTAIGGTLPSPRDADTTECEPLPGLEDVDVDALVLEIYDIDRDGKLSETDFDEWDRFERAELEEGDPSVEEIDGLLDVDGDGEIGTDADRAELRSFIGRHLIDAWLERTPADC